MALIIRNPVAEKLAREVARRTGESLTQAIVHALEERLQRIEAHRAPTGLYEEIMTISERCAGLPDLDDRTPEEILGYDDQGDFSMTDVTVAVWGPPTS